MHAYSPQKMHMRSCMRIYATSLPWKLLRTYHESCASIVQDDVCRSLLLPVLLSRPNPSSDTLRSRNPSKSTLAHDTVAAAVLHKHHSIICVSAGLIQFVYGSHSRLAEDLAPNKVLFSPWFSRALVYVYMYICKYIYMYIYTYKYSCVSIHMYT